MLERALSLPPGEYDVYVRACLDRNRLKTSSPVIRHVKPSLSRTFWNDEIALSSLILASDIRVLGASPSAKQQVEHPYYVRSRRSHPGRGAGVFVRRCVVGGLSGLQLRRAGRRPGAPTTTSTASDTPTRVLFNRTPSQHFRRRGSAAASAVGIGGLPHADRVR